MTAGINHFRIEFVDEKPEDVVKVINMYQDVCKNIEMLCASEKTEYDHNDTSMSSSYSTSYNNNDNKKNVAERNIESTLNVLWKFLEIVPNGYGLPQGVSLGSLKPTLERNWDSLKPTARR
jgi:collagenase-like PrtC family protease